MSPKRFNIRVYGLLFNQRGEVLVSDEKRNGYAFTKFPGGGLEWGEGTMECLRREFQEEAGIEIEVGELFYLTDFFQQSAFSENDQLISIYYRVIYPDASIILSQTQPETIDYEVVRWISCTEISEHDMTFPVDKVVAEMIRKEWLNE